MPIILRVNTELHGSVIKPHQLCHSELIWDNISKCLVYKNHKTQELHYLTGGGGGGGGWGSDPGLAAALSDHINDTDVHWTATDRSDFEEAKHVINDLRDIDFENFVIKDDIITSDYTGTVEDDMIMSANYVQELLDNKSDDDHTHDDRYYTKDDVDELITDHTHDQYINKDQIDQPNGVPGLNSSGKLDTSVMPEGAVGGLDYKGLWDPTTNTPTLGDNGLNGKNGEYYKVSIASPTPEIDGEKDWYPGDWIIHNGTTWDKIDNTETIISVNSKTGIVTLNKSDIGLDEVDNTSDLDKPISTATQLELDLKEDAFEKEDAFNKRFGTGYDDVARGDHIHLDSHWHTNKVILDGMTAAFTTELYTKLEGIEDGANNYVHPTDADNKHVPVADAADKVLTSTSTPGEYEWKSPNAVTEIPSSAVKVDTELVSVDGTDLNSVLVEFDRILVNKVAFINYSTQEVIKDGDNIVYVLKEDEDSNYMFKKITKGIHVLIEYATKLNNPAIYKYDDAKLIYKTLTYGEFSDAT